MTNDGPPTLGLVLAGGLARRMGGGDKPLIDIGGAPILDRVLARLTPHCRASHPQCQRRPRRALRPTACRSSPTMCRASPARSRAYWRASTGRRRTGPTSPGSRARPPIARSCRAISCRGCMRRASRRALPLACARSGAGGTRWSDYGRSRCASDLRHALVNEGLRKIEAWTARHGVALAEWPAEPIDPFFNVNTPEDVAEAQRLVARYAA